MKTFKHMVCFFPVILVACSTQDFSSPPIQTSPIPLSNSPSQTATRTEPTNLDYSPTHTLALPPSTVTPFLHPVATSTLPPYPYPQPVLPATPEPTSSPTSTPTLEPPGLLNRKDPLSLVRWLQYGLENQDLSFIEPLLADEIRYSLAFSDLPGEILSKETFLSELQRRLSNHPSCFSYAARLGEINTLSISTEGWTPPWEFDGTEWFYLVLAFSDQWTKEEGLYLYGAFVSRIRAVFGGSSETPCR